MNTKLLNGCYDVGDRYFEPAYPAADRPYVVVAQGGMQIAELNAYLELVPPDAAERSLKAAGIGNGQTIAGAVSGNTHGSQINFGAMPDFVVGLHIATGSGQTAVDRARDPSPSSTTDFADKLGADLIRDDDIFDAAVVSFGTFGIIAAVAVETAPVYQLEFRPIVDISHDDLKTKLGEFGHGRSGGPLPLRVHLRSAWPHADGDGGERAEGALRAPAVPTPKPRWIVRDKNGYAPGINVLRPAGPAALSCRPASRRASSSSSTARSRCSTSVAAARASSTPRRSTTSRATPRARSRVSVNDAPQMIDICSAGGAEMRLPSISQVRLVRAPRRRRLGFTQHAPNTAVFEFGLINDTRFPEFERRMDEALRAAGVRYTMHWSKNSGIDPDKLHYMYGAAKIESWKAARRAVFGNDATLMQMFETDAMVRAGLA